MKNRSDTLIWDGFNSFRRSTKRLLKRFTSRGLVLMYHHIAAPDADPWFICTSPQNFAAHLEVLQRHCQPISLGRLAAVGRNDRIAKRAVAITFDDGYANNLHEAKPLLERYNIPATVFISTGYIGKKREFWWDELSQILLNPKRLPETLCLKFESITRRWILGAAVNYSIEDYQCDRHREPGTKGTSPRMSFYYSVYHELRDLPEAQRREVMEKIRAWAHVDPLVRSTHRPLTLEEVSTLERGGLMEVGAHTVTHPKLPAHSVTFQHDEVSKSKTDLENVLGHPVTSFAYPFGAHSKDTVRVVRDAGFSCACTTVEEAVWHYSQCFRLPRFGVPNWNGEQFEKQLLEWFRS